MPPPPAPPPPRPCGWAELPRLCRGLARDVYANSADECREACCADEGCAVFQWSEPVGLGALGVSCWRGIPRTCDGPNPTHPDGAAPTDIAGRRTSRNYVLLGGGSLGGGDDNRTGAPDGQPNPMGGQASGIGLGDLVALLTGGAIVGMLCLCVLGFFYCRHCACFRRSERQVVPVVRNPADKYAASDAAGGTLEGAVAARAEHKGARIAGDVSGVTAGIVNSTNAAVHAVERIGESTIAAVNAVERIGESTIAAVHAVERIGEQSLAAVRPGYLKKKQMMIAMQRQAEEEGRKRKLAEQKAKEEEERRKRREAKLLASKISFVDVVEDELLHNELGVLPPTPQRLHRDWAKRDKAAIIIQRTVRAKFVRKYLREWRRHRAAKRLQAAARRYIARRTRAALVIQRKFRPKLDLWASQRREARRLAAELNDVMESTRDAAAREAFAHRFAEDTRDVDEMSNDGGEDDAMEAYLDSLRRAAYLID